MDEGGPPQLAASQSKSRFSYIIPFSNHPKSSIVLFNDFIFHPKYHTASVRVSGRADGEWWQIGEAGLSVERLASDSCEREGQGCYEVQGGVAVIKRDLSRTYQGDGRWAMEAVRIQGRNGRCLEFPLSSRPQPQTRIAVRCG